MTINELNSQLTLALKEYIKSSHHYETGALYKSIKFTCSDIPTKGLDIKFNAMEYINYLDDGEFINTFFSSTKVVNILTTYLSTIITLG